jgi:hypothetical protein
MHSIVSFSLAIDLTRVTSHAIPRYLPGATRAWRPLLKVEALDLAYPTGFSCAEGRSVRCEFFLDICPFVI